MTPIQAIGLGIIQGLTEFLPISSSGHLVLAQSFIKDFSQPGVLFDVVLHAGTLFAVLWYFRKRILSLDRRMLWLLLVGTIPAALVGITFQNQLEGLFSNPQAVGMALLFTGGMNWMVDKIKIKNRQIKISEKKVLVVGVFQALAIIPGISRSGSTIFAGVWQGLKREDAATFSFLLSVPAVAGAAGLQLLKHGKGDDADFVVYFLGFAVAAVVGYLSIGLLMRLLIGRHFKAFAFYVFLVGLTTLVLTG